MIVKKRINICFLQYGYCAVIVLNWGYRCIVKNEETGYFATKR